MKVSENLFHYFEQAGMKIQYHPNDIIYMQEDDVSNLYLIIKGRVRVFEISSTGEEMTYEVLDKGHIFGESSFLKDSLRPTTVSAVNEVELISCPLEHLYPYLQESKELTIALLQLMSERCNYVAHLLKKSLTYNRYEKIASFLLEQTLHDNIDKGIINQTLPYTHEDIAATVGLARVTVTKVLNEFAKKGYIQNKYRRIVIVNRQALAAQLKKHQ